jgi:hypothetical protein
VLGHLIMLKYPWQSLFYTMIGMGVTVGLLAVFIPGMMQVMPLSNDSTLARRRSFSVSRRIAKATT